jgi:RND family efflux transporter MFP subunit
MLPTFSRPVAPARGAAAVLAVLASLLMPGCAPPATAAAPAATAPPLPVLAATVVAEDVARPVRASGLLVARRELRLSFKVGGVVRSVAAEEGRAVRAGAPLAALDLSEVDPLVAQAREARDKAVRDLARVERLHAESVATLSQLQDARTGAEVAENALRAASFNQRHAVITAPADGRVLRRLAEPGEVIAPGQPALLFASFAGGEGGGWVVRAGLADRDAVRVAVGDVARVTLDAHPGRTFDARVTEVPAAALPGTGTAEVELTLQVPVGAAAPRLLSGLAAKVEVTPAVRARVLLVPVESLVEGDGDSASVFTLAPDGRSARRERVRVAFLDGASGRAALHAGPAEGARVVTAGAAQVREGAPLTLVADSAVRN